MTTQIDTHRMMTCAMDIIRDVYNNGDEPDWDTIKGNAQVIMQIAELAMLYEECYAIDRRYNRVRE